MINFLKGLSRLGLIIVLLSGLGAIFTSGLPFWFEALFFVATAYGINDFEEEVRNSERTDLKWYYKRKYGIDE